MSYRNNPIAHMKTRNVPFTHMEKERIEKFFEKWTAKGLTDISAEIIGFRGEMSFADFNSQEYDSNTKPIFKITNVSLDQIYAQDQDGVGMNNLKRVYAHWYSAPLPQAVLMKNGYYWLEEGHHRLALQKIAGRRKMKVYAEIYRK